MTTCALISPSPRWPSRSPCAASWPRRCRACQHTSAQLARFARGHNLTRVLLKNAAAESFWATVKVDFWQRYLGPTPWGPKLAVGDWIERISKRAGIFGLGMLCPAEYNKRTLRRQNRLPGVRQTGPAHRTLLLVHPQPLRQILKRHEHNRIITPHQRRLAHPGPDRPTLTMPQLHNQIRQCVDARERA
jgi:hypothetical protein